MRGGLYRKGTMGLDAKGKRKAKEEVVRQHESRSQGETRPSGEGNERRVTWMGRSSDSGAT